MTLTRDSGDRVATTDVTVRGPAVDLLHMVSRRRPLAHDTAFVVTGDRTELVHLIDNMRWIGA